MAAASSGRAEVDTSRAFRSVKEAVAVFDERLLIRETQFRSNTGACRGGERSSRPNAIAIAASAAKLEGSDGARPSGFLIRESHSRTNAIADAKHEGSSSQPASSSSFVPRAVSEAMPMYLVPSSPPFFASSPSLANDDDEQDHHKDADLMVMSSIKKVEEAAAKARQEVVQLKKRLAEMELSMAMLNAKLHRALSKLAHMEADRAAAEGASIGQQRDHGHGNMALTVWAERRAPRQPLGHLLRLGEADGEVVDGQRRVVAARRVPKQKPIVPLVIPLINDMLFSKRKKRMKDKESLYMKELYSLLRLS